VGLHDAVQSFVQEANTRCGRNGRPVLISNCTVGGAYIEGATRMTLNEFMEAVARAAKPGLVEPSSGAVDLSAPMSSLSDGMGTYVPIARQIVHDCRRMQREIDSSPVDMARVRRLQDELRQHIQAEEGIKRDPGTGPWISPLLDAVDGVLKKTPGLISESTDPHVQLRFLQTRYDFMADLCLEMRKDLDAARAGMDRPEAVSERSPYRFESFRRFALRMLARNNKELAHLIEKSAPQPDRFLIHWINQYIPYVKIRSRDSSWQPLTSFVSMFDQARSDVDTFLKTTEWQPGSSGVLFAVPGNWAHVLEFSSRFPGADVMAVDPWVDLLSTMIDRGCFLNRLPQDALVIGLHPKLREAQALCRARLRDWQARGLGCAVFPHPRAGRVAEVGEACERVIQWVTEANGSGGGRA
jgi:hypothetical protein